MSEATKRYVGQILGEDIQGHEVWLTRTPTLPSERECDNYIIRRYPCMADCVKTGSQYRVIEVKNDLRED